MSRILGIQVVADGAGASGLKRQLFSQAFGGADLLVGPNGAGKTTHGPLGITAVLEGLATVPTDPRRPWVGSLPTETLIRATVETPAGPVVLERDLSAVRGRKAEQATQAAREHVGIPPTAWDLSDFASGTGGDRGKILDAVARAGGQLRQWSAPEAQLRVEELMSEVVPEGVEAEEWLSGWAECCEHYKGAPDGATLLRSALTWTEEHQRASNADQRAARAAAEELGQSVPPDPEGDPAADEKERARYLPIVAGASDRAQQIADAEAALARHQAEGRRLLESMGATQGEGERLARPPVAPVMSIPPELHDRIARAEAALQAPIEAPEADLEGLKAERTKARAALTRAAKKAQAAREAEVKAREAATAAGGAYRDADLAHTRAQAALDGLSTGAQGATCRHCGQSDPLGVGDRITEAEAEEARTREDVASLGCVHLETQRAQADAETARSEANRAESEALQAANRAEARLSAAVEAMEQHEPQVRAAQQRELERATAELARAEVVRDAAQRRHEQAEAQREQDLAAARKRWIACRDAVAQWEALDVPVVPEPVDEAALEAAQKALAEIEARLEARRRLLDHRKMVRQALVRYEDLKVQWDASRALLRAIRSARDELANAAYRPIHDTARQILGGAPELPQPYFRGPDDYGAQVQGHGQVPFAGLAESEQRITAAALVAALAAVAGNPCRLVLLDGLEVVQRDHRVPLLQALVAARESGVVDQVVATMATEPDEPLGELRAIEGLTLHELQPWIASGPVEAPPPKRAPAGPSKPAVLPDEVPF